MKYIKYYAIIIGSVLCVLVPPAIFLAALDLKSIPVAAIGGVMVPVAYLVSKKLTGARASMREVLEYDEFGRSKSKGTYDRLSKRERDLIDLQKTARMEQIVNTSALKKLTHEGSGSPQEDMDRMVGLVSVKEKMCELVARMKFDSERDIGNTKKSGNAFGRHMAFFGPPGTGKTSVARILTGFLYQYGYIKQNKCVEIDGNFLKAGKDTAIKTELTVMAAFDGVLFIDEAYTLADKADGSAMEAVAELIKQMEDHRDRFILILAGYSDEMKVLLDSNPGFSSRIKDYFEFPPYTDEEMGQIFTLMAKQNGFDVAADAFGPFNERVRKERRMRFFGNARTVRNILDETLDRHSLNFMEGRLDTDDRFRIRGMDINPNPKRDIF